MQAPDLVFQTALGVKPTLSARESLQRLIQRKQAEVDQYKTILTMLPETLTDAQNAAMWSLLKEAK